MLGVLYLVFTNILKSNIVNYPLYLLLGLIMWNMFSRSTSNSLNAIISRRGVVSQIYFPREVLPIATCITTFIMMIFEFGAFAVFMIFFHFIPPYTIAFLPLLLVLLFALSLGISFSLSVGNVYFRDLQYIWNVILQAGFFTIPIIFSLDVYHNEAIKKILYLNPVTGIIDIAHNTMLYGTLPTANELTYTVVLSFIILFFGYAVFRKFESKTIEVL